MIHGSEIDREKVNSRFPSGMTTRKTNAVTQTCFEDESQKDKC